MAKQTRTAAEIAQVASDFDTFQLPFPASLNLTDFTAYGVTDPEIALSMVNVRHMTATRQFRGEWNVGGQTDGNLMVPFTAGQIVIAGGQFYQLTAMGNASTNPETDAQTDWTLVGGALNDAFTVEGSTGTEVNPSVRFQQGSHTAMDVQFTSPNMNIVKTADRVITFDNTPPPTLNPRPESFALNAFRNTDETIAIALPASSGTITGSPTATATMVGTTDTLTLTSANLLGVGEVSAVVPNSRTPAMSYSIAAVATIVDNEVGTQNHAGITANIPITFVDARTGNEPTVSDNLLVSAIDQNQVNVFNIDIAPNSSDILDGTAYSVTGFTAQIGTGAQLPVSTATSFTVPRRVVADTTITFRFPFMSLNGQTTPPGLNQIRMVNTYLPYFVTTGTAAPTSIAGLTASTAGLPGTTGADITATGTVGNSIFVIAPTTGVNTINLRIGATSTNGINVGTIMVPNALNTGNVTYGVYQFAGLAMSPTTFTLTNS